MPPFCHIQGESMTVDRIAKAVKSGNQTLIPVLWEQTHRYIFYCLRQLEHHNPANAERMIQMGLTHEDIRQEAYFILLDAVDQYKPDRDYTFLNSVKYAATNRFFSIIGMRTKEQRCNPLPLAERLEKPISNGEEDIFIGDLVPDENAVIAFESVTNDIVREELKKEIFDALSELDSDQRVAIDYFFFHDQQLQSCQKAVDFSQKELTSNKNKALRKIRRTHGKKLIPYAEELGIIQKYTYRSSLNSFKNTWTSSTERAAIKLIEHKEHC